ncbi:MAG: hypothetical protein MK066_14050 [Crocinitomicaceae bacterium]|nr:hypothetical protein [Crocinitomicaceae bacterium]
MKRTSIIAGFDIEPTGAVLNYHLKQTQSLLGEYTNPIDTERISQKDFVKLKREFVNDKTVQITESSKKSKSKGFVAWTVIKED